MIHDRLSNHLFKLYSWVLRDSHGSQEIYTIIMIISLFNVDKNHKNFT